MNSNGGVKISTFFIVDDDAILRKHYHNLLKINGHEIIGEADNGEECLEKLSCNETEPDFIIMDHHMPNKNGLEVMKELLKLNPNRKIIFISGDKSVRNKALASGAHTFIEKPFDVHEFFEIINQLNI
jgi:two-component system chemotaxis response regulator CheY